jgi:hypothetical protein
MGEVFRRLNLELSVEATGCCGMSGTYGHEACNQATSRLIFDQSWKRKLSDDTPGEPLATGYWLLVSEPNEAPFQQNLEAPAGGTVGSVSRHPGKQPGPL